MIINDSAIIKKANTLCQSGYYNDAIKLYFFAEESENNFFPGYYANKIGRCYEAMGDLHAAKFWYGWARHQNPTSDDDAENDRRLAHITVFDLIPEQDLYCHQDQAIEINHDLLREKTQALLKAKRYRDALKLIFFAADRDPAPYARVIAQCYEALDDLHAAKFWYGQALRYHPADRHDVLNHQRLAHVTIFHLIPEQDACLHGRAALVINYNLINQTGQALMTAGRYHDALRLYFFATDNDPSFDDGSYAHAIAACYEAIGDLHAAKFWYGRAVDNNPGIDRYVRDRQRLETLTIFDLIPETALYQPRPSPSEGGEI